MKKLIATTLIVLSTLLSQAASTVNVHDFGATGDGSTDDTAAVQSALNYAISNGGASIFFPCGVYVIGGALQATTTYNAQLYVPQDTAQPTRCVTVSLEGELLPGQAMNIVNANYTNFGGAVIKSTCTTSGGAVLSTFNSASGNFLGFNPVTIEIKNLTFQVPTNPALVALNLRQAYAAKLDGVTVYTGVSPYTVSTGSAPSVAGSIGIATPANNNAAFTTLRNTSVSGFYTGYEFNEHTDGDNVSAWACVRAGAVPAAYHPLCFGKLMVVGCSYGLVWTGAARVSVGCYDVEHEPTGWWQSVQDLQDSTGLGSADVVWAAVLGGNGISHTFLASSNLAAREIGTGSSTGSTGGAQPSTPPEQTGFPILSSYDADSLSGTVGLWPDLGANHWNLSAGVGPTTSHNALNGHSAAAFNGSQYLVNSSYAVSGAHEIFCVANVSAFTSNWQFIYDSISSSSRQCAYLYSSTGILSEWAGNDVLAGSPPYGSWAVYDFVFNGSSSAVYINGHLISSGNVGANAMSGIVMGARSDNTFPVRMNLAHFDDFSGVLNSTARANVLNWYVSRYQLTLP